MAASAIPAQSVPAPRIQSVDALRGAIMMLMAIDHIRDYVARSAQQFLPTDLTRTTPAIFFTRWITHFCAPVFMLTAGFGAYFWISRGHHSKSELSRLLFSRGIWLIVLEVTILRLIFFSQISFTVNPVILTILWAIGISMIGPGNVNQPNKGGRPSAEAGEGRTQTRENIVPSHMHPTQSGTRMSQGLDGVRKAARERKQEQFTALLHHLNVDLLRDSFFALQRKASPGVDGVTWQEYESGLEDRLVDLHSRVHRGTYRAKPSRRVFIPKADGRQRPLGVAALEDKIVQQAVVTILNQIYEVDFKGFSYGFRPGRSPHQALDALT